MTTRFAVNPPDEDRDGIDPVKEAETIRLEQWDIFVASLRDYAAALGWPHVIWAVHQVFLGERRVCVCMGEIHDFADLYGWPDTLRAIAQAMSADEQAKREAMDRR